MKTGVYKIENIRTKKCYIGSGVDIFGRFATHRTQLKQGIHYNRRLQMEYNKYSKYRFRFSVLLFCDKKNLLMYEQRAMDTFRSAEKGYGYNLSPTAGTSKGVKYTKESKEKIKNTTKKQFETLGHPLLGKHHTKEARRNQSIAAKKYWDSDKSIEGRKRIIESNKRRARQNK